MSYSSGPFFVSFDGENKMRKLHRILFAAITATAMMTIASPETVFAQKDSHLVRRSKVVHTRKVKRVHQNTPKPAKKHVKKSFDTYLADNSPIYHTHNNVITPARYRWADNEITYKIVAPTNYYQAIWKVSIAQWNSLGVVQLTVAGDSTPDITLGVSNGSNPNHTGLTTLSYKTSSANGTGLIKFKSANSVIYQNVCQNNHYSSIEQLHVAEHELGHALGLTHSSSPTSIMYPQTKDNSISTADAEGLAEAYQ